MIDVNFTIRETTYYTGLASIDPDRFLATTGMTLEDAIQRSENELLQSYIEDNGGHTELHGSVDGQSFDSFNITK